MKTKDFIKILQEADPSGEAHIRMSGGVPYRAEHKEGYWDGAYDYVNEEGKWVHTIKDSKVDIYCKEPNDMIDNVLHNWNSYKESDEGLWEKVKDQFVFELGGYAFPEQRQEKIDSFLSGVKEHFDWYVNYEKETWKKYLQDVIVLHKSGCRFFRKKEVGNMIYYSGWKWINKKNPKNVGSANLAHTYPILKSGKFEQVQCTKLFMKDYYEYKLIE